VSSPWAAEKVADSVADVAKRLSAEVLVVHVSRPSGGQLREQEQADGEAAIRLLRDKLQQRDVPVQDLLMSATTSPARFSIPQWNGTSA